MTSLNNISNSIHFPSFNQITKAIISPVQTLPWCVAKITEGIRHVSLPTPKNLLVVGTITYLSQSASVEAMSSFYMTDTNGYSCFKIEYDPLSQSKVNSLKNACGYTRGVSCVSSDDRFEDEEDGVCTQGSDGGYTWDTVNMLGHNTTKNNTKCMKKKLQHICSHPSASEVFTKLFLAMGITTGLCCMVTACYKVNKYCTQANLDTQQGYRTLLNNP